MPQIVKKKVKYLLIVDDYLPHSCKVAGKMMHDLALELTLRGNYVTVLTPGPDQKHTLVQKQVDGIDILFVKSGKIKNISRIVRAINEILLPWLTWKATKLYFKTHTFDAIVYYSPTIFWGYLVKKLKYHFKCNSYLILRDIFPQWTVDNGIISSYSPVYKFFKFFEKVNYRSAERIGVMSPNNLEFLQNTIKDSSKLEVLYNWAKVSDIKNSVTQIRKEYNLEGKIVMFFGGNIGNAQHIMNLVYLAKQFINDPNVHFLFVGQGDEVNILLDEKEKYNLVNVTYFPQVCSETYFDMLNEFDIGLFSLHPDHKTHNFPGKLLGYMDNAKPILGCVNMGNDLKEIVNEAKAGIIVNSDDSEGLFLAAKSLVESEELRKEMGLNARQLLTKKFSVQSACTQIESALN